ncbi:MAG: RluA family pseudouridine synthase [Brucellaceae bacterium]|nr:RluA family pseudouridine synthase [Brucellaceae bacterium]
MPPDSQPAAIWKELTAGDGAAGRRIDQWLAGELAPDLSRARIQGLMEAGSVLVDGLPAKPKMKLSGGEVIAVSMPEPEDPEPRGEAIALDVLYEDGQLIVINKPAGLVVHPGAGNASGTLVNALIHHCGDSLSGIGGVRRPGIVHRLDKDTTGVMVAAKTDLAHRILSEAFADHGRTGDLERAYWALVWGTPPRMTGTIDAPLGRSGKDRTRRAVVREGHADARHAVTHFTTLERYGMRPDSTAVAALVECRLETGRTHQIRVHMAHIGHPLIGDRDYGQSFFSKANALPEPAASAVRAFPRQALHARLLAFRHPETGDLMRFEADPPADMTALARALSAL